jgi:argininosuccinate lyase
VTTDVSERASKNFVAATELANLLVRNYGVPFRSAHKIVGFLVKTLTDAKMTFAETTPKLVAKAAQESAGIKLAVKSGEIKALADPVKIVEACSVKGGPAPAEVKRALCERKKQVLLTKSNISKMDKELGEAEDLLENTIQTYLP